MNERIAVIDDNRDAAETLAKYFKQYKMTVVVYTSCEEFLESGKIFDAVVTDTNLGDGMNGFECADKMHSRFPNAVIVGTSVVEPEKSDEYRRIYQRSDADDFINKLEGDSTIASRVLELLSIRGPST